MAKGPVRERISTLLDMTANPQAMAREVSEQSWTPATVKPKSQAFSSRFSVQLEEAGLVRRAPDFDFGKRNPVLAISPFVVFEEKQGYGPHGGRLRPIMWTKDHNSLAAAYGYRCQVVFPTSPTVLSRVECECASQRDLAASFFQIPIPEESQKYFTYRDDKGEAYCLTRLPMGASWSPELMHLIMYALSHCYLSTPPTAVFSPSPSTSTPELCVDVYVDNVRYAGTWERVREATAAFDVAARRAGATISEASDGDTEYVFLGFGFHCRREVGVGPKVARKLRAARADLMAQGETKPRVRRCDLESLGGRLVWASPLVVQPLGRFIDAIIALRRNSNALNRGAHPDEEVQLSAQTTEAAVRWIDAALQPRMYKEFTEMSRGRGVEIWSDASVTGCGVVVSAGGALRSFGRRWTWEEADELPEEQRSTRIAVLEARAVVYGMEECVGENAWGANVKWYLDNTAVIGALQRGYSPARALNREVMRILGLTSSYFTAVQWAYIKSRDNPADKPSRR